MSKRSNSGPNAWLVDEMYEQYRSDPVVGERDLAGVLRRLPPAAVANGSRRRPARARTGAVLRAGARRRRRPHRAEPPTATPATRSAAPAPRIVANMEAQPRRARRPPASATCRPSCSRSTAASSTATSAARGGGKVSFTHLIGYAVVRAIADAVPVMNYTFVEGADGKPRVVAPRARRTSASPSTSRSPTAAARSSCPVHPRRRHARLRRVLAAYEDLIRKVAHQQAQPSTTSQGATVTLTNPGTIGTVQSRAAADARARA